MPEPTTIEEKPEMEAVSFWPGNPLSYATTQLIVFRNDIQLGTASAFVMRYGTTYALITNWHVVSGINPTTGQCLSPTGALPNRIDCHVAVSQKTIEDGRQAEVLHFKPLSIDLYLEGQPIWVDDRVDPSQNDYVAINLRPLVPELAETGVELRSITGGKITLKRGRPKPSAAKDCVPLDDVSTVYPPIGSEVFVLGYPKGIAPQGVFPIWKRASIASEPQASIRLGGVECTNMLYIDALTKSGMSGSPVVYICRKGDTLYADDGVMVQASTDEPVIVGVYAGREGVTNDEYELSLGRVWKVQAVERLLLPMGMRE